MLSHKIFGLIILTMSSQLWAAPQVFPTRVVLSDKTKTAQVALRHIGNTPMKYRISLVYYKMGPDGSMKEEKNVKSETQSARDMIRFSPKRVELKPNGEQVVRIVVRKRSTTLEGEYRIHLHFEEEDLQVKDKSNADKSSVAMSLTPRLAVAIPIFVRVGAPQVKASLSNLKLVTVEKTKTAFSVEILNTGNANVYGDFRVYQVVGGSKKLVGEVNGVSSLIERRKAVFVLSEPQNLDLSKKGKLLLELKEPLDDGAAILAMTEINL